MEIKWNNKIIFNSFKYNLLFVLAFCLRTVKGLIVRYHTAVPFVFIYKLQIFTQSKLDCGMP